MMCLLVNRKINKTMKPTDKIILDLIKESLKDPAIKREIIAELLLQSTTDKPKQTSSYRGCGSHGCGLALSGCH